ncbi:MAG TPA: hypothetical protein VM406_16485 [Noviherbaspirillum sp.]|nr:hypothetical protein [Noviherbaspirillum sp.]
MTTTPQEALRKALEKELPSLLGPAFIRAGVRAHDGLIDQLSSAFAQHLSRALAQQAAQEPQPVAWSETGALTVLNMTGDGPYGADDVAETIAFLNAAEIVRGNIVSAAAPAKPADIEQAHRWATELAVSMARKFYPEAPQFEPLPDLVGVISQIDNMTTGLVRAKPAENDFPAYMNALLTCKQPEVVRAARVVMAWYQGEELPVPPQISRVDADYWLDNRAAILEAIERAGYRLTSNAQSFRLDPVAKPAEQEKACPTCRGNDMDAPCAYPSKGMPGCLRDKRLAEQQAPATEQAPPLPEHVDVIYSPDGNGAAIEVYTVDQLRAYAEQYAAWKIAALRSEQAPAFQECRHCGWECRPNTTAAKRWYPLEQAPAAQTQEQEASEAFQRGVSFGANAAKVELMHLLAAQSQPSTAQEQAPAGEVPYAQKLELALAECRDAFPIPAPGSEIEGWWIPAMGDPLEVPGYVKACVSTPPAVPPLEAKVIEEIRIKQGLLEWNRSRPEPVIKIGMEYGVAGKVLALISAAPAAPQTKEQPKEQQESKLSKAIKAARGGDAPTNFKGYA